ncbi:MAG: MFS transporter, partial [Pseudomonadota bacterium]
MNFDQETTQKIKEGRSKFLAMVTAYFLGNFNDNYYKQAAMLLAVASGKSHLQGTATILFSLPYVLFSSYGGWLADRFPKRKVIIATKIMELVAMIIGAIGLLAMNWTAVMVMLFIMGMQASMFSPALNGSIPELYPECYITKANAIVKLATTLAILLGIAFAGICLDQKWWETSIPFGIILVSATVVILGIIGVFCSFYTYRGEAKDPQARFPLSGPCRSVVELYRLKDRQDLLFTII